MLIMLLSEAFCQKAKDVVIGDTLVVGATLLYEENFEN